MICRYKMMLECWQHSAVRRPSFIQLLDQLAADLSDEFRNVSYYFNHEPDNDDVASDSRSTDSQIASAEDVNETVPFRAPSSAQPRSELSSSAADSKVSDSRNLATENDLQSSGFVGHSSTDRKPRSAEFIEMSGPLNVTTANSEQLSSQADGFVDDRRSRGNSQKDSRETETSCQNDVPGVGDAESKDSSGSSLGSCKNGLINGHVIPCGITF